MMRLALSGQQRPAIAVLAVAAASVVAPAAADDAFFTQQVQPLLARRCFACHGPDDAEGGLAFHTPDALTTETDSGETPIVPGDAGASEMIRRVLSRDDWEQMPPEGDRLTPKQVEILKRWINDGASYAEHWAFVPPSKPALPAVSDSAWPRNAIDHFVLARLKKKGLSPAQQADRRTLIRRVTHDLIGLPPTEVEVDSFLSDAREDAYDRLIERLLASPHYGERWGRHWLDVVRFAETNSFERDNPKPNAWKFRDYVIKSFNDDKPFNRFLIEQLAGDELGDRSLETLTATGYLRLGIWDDEPADPKLNRFDQLDDLVSTTGQAMLGLTVGCARCHDHKIDPIPQADYYEMAAFFGGLTEYARRGDQLQAEWSQIDVSPPETLAEYARLDEALRVLDGKMYTVEQQGVARMSAPDQRLSEGPRRKKLLKEKLNEFLTDEERATYQALKSERAELQASKKRLPRRDFVLGVAKADPTPDPMFVMQRGNAHAPGQQVEPAYLDVLGGGSPEEILATESTSGRRRALAEWIASPDNTLTARVAVNRIWQHHFGRGIVPTPNNFGQLGSPPTHPQLLDWLAVTFVENGWSFKQMHRLILKSATYQMANEFSENSYAVDPANQLLWRRDLRRMDAEELRDTILAVTGELDRTVGGPSVYPEIEEEVRQGLSRPDAGWPTTTGPKANRRSVYIFVKRSLVMPLLAAFDYPDPDSTCEARFKTTQPGQSLALLNSQFLQRQAGRLALSIDTKHRQPLGNLEFAEEVFKRTIGRSPTTDELERADQFLTRVSQTNSNKRARELFCLLSLNTNEFLYIQ